MLLELALKPRVTNTYPRAPANRQRQDFPCRTHSRPCRNLRVHNAGRLHPGSRSLGEIESMRRLPLAVL